MSDDIRDLLHDAVSGVAAPPATPALANRLALVDRRRKLTVMVAGAAAMVAGTFGAAAAWPEHQSPIRLEIVGDETDADAEEAAEEPVLEADVLPAEVEAEPTPTPLPTPETDAPTSQPVPLELDWLAGFELAPLATATPIPQAVPPQPAPDDGGHEPQHEEQQPPTPTPEPQRHVEPEPEPEPEEHHEEPVEGDHGAETGVHTFTASALYGSCEEPIPYDVYSGTAAPGATVTVTSPYSASTSTTADGSGHWSVQVTFEAAPVGEPFTVTIASGGESVGVGFVRIG